MLQNMFQLTAKLTHHVFQIITSVSIVVVEVKFTLNICLLSMSIRVNLDPQNGHILFNRQFH